MTHKKMSLDEISKIMNDAAKRAVLGRARGEQQTCPKCMALGALKHARLIAASAEPLSNRLPEAYALLEVALETIGQWRLVLCGRHAAEFFADALAEPRGNMVHVKTAPMMPEEDAVTCKRCGRPASQAYGDTCVDCRNG